MGPVELTAIAGVIISVSTSLLVPWMLRRRQAARAASDTNVVSWQSITAVLQKERDAFQLEAKSLRDELDTLQGENRRAIRALDDEYSAQLLTARRRITQLEAEVAALYERLRRLGDFAMPGDAEPNGTATAPATERPPPPPTS